MLLPALCKTTLCSPGFQDFMFVVLQMRTYVALHK
uniref:Uncharacterized protein n=1 Tax=Anguilla anguilla TaxID=7936 RepID=A0A0E9V0U9_ANGAN